ncbi:globin-1-like [Actinia tenebrosa]|uniref:Globin-1-like n=1 Tax=Actinia tenebrosa TaxID=6105 RepID=A0A2K9UYR2_ACTTE|nr:globin-1-like [Actinia tenebrosa]XP_031556129.1 globin-1-like [Actinia tenebrosa]XP_031556130.1 globin-1-like [Actinia tenebrosa]AUV50082.1 globin-like protein [Actinia tenebrosa]
MGCSSSIDRHQRRVNPDPIDIPLSKAQKYLVRETWETVELYKNNVGKQTFLRFFENNPEFQKLFPEFKELKYEELQKANALHGHAKRVMKAVENAVSAMDDAVSFSAYLEELGRRHVARSLKPSYLDAMQAALMDSLRQTLQSEWTDETAIAWNKLFRFIADTMITGLQSSHTT